MNIFFLDKDSKKCAEYHCDKHIVKMVLETAQLLCGAHHITNDIKDIPYKLSHKNHPCAIWARESIFNYLKLCDIGINLCREYTYRYEKTHKSQLVIEWCIKNLPPLENKGLTDIPKAMPIEYKVDCPIQSYRNYYIGAKTFATWKKREIPTWYNKN
jgi:hypothetical protein